MVKNPPENCQHIVPYLAYRDAPAALEFLCKAFGFRKGLVIPGPEEGQLGHAELHRDGETLMLASEYEPAKMQSPSSGAGMVTASLNIYVDDVDAHFEQAKAAGAEIASEPADQFYGDRTYTAVDPEGHRWSFSQHVKDVDFDAMLAGAEARAEAAKAAAEE